MGNKQRWSGARGFKGVGQTAAAYREAMTHIHPEMNPGVGSRVEA